MEALTGFVQEGFIYVVACVILLGILVFVHELGHFMVARWCGVRVEVFSLGFGKKIFSWVRGETTYCVSLIPLGGYVKMFGEQPGENIPAEHKAVSFTHKTVWQRIAIVLAGPLMNLFFAILVFAAVAMIGQDARSPQLGDVDSASEAFRLGFRSGDQVIAINGEAVETFEDIADQMDHAIGGRLKFQLRDSAGTERNIEAPITSKPNMNPLSLRETVGEIEGLSANSKSSLIGVLPQSPLAVMGLKSGDRIASLNGKPVSMFRQIDEALKAVDASRPIEIEAERSDEGGKSEKLSLTYAGPERNLTALGLEGTDLYLWKVIDGSPAVTAGLKAGDRLVSINGTKLTKWEDVLNTVRSYNGTEGLSIEYTRAGAPSKVQIFPQVTSQVNAYGSEDRRYTIGIMPLVQIAPPLITTLQTANPFKAIASGVEQTKTWSVVGFLSIVRLIQSKISPKTIGGILSIGQAAGETLKLGLSKFLTMMGIISVHLFVLNLLPVPVLDGGHLVFYLIEVVKGSPLSLRKIEVAQQVGLVLLMCLMVFALFNDVTRIIFGRL